MDTPALETRERLLEAAIAVVDESGVEGIRVRDIAAAADVREPSVYHYFGSREGLVEAVEAARFKRDLTEVASLFYSAVNQCTSADEYVALCRRVVSATSLAERASVRAVRASVFGSAQSRPELAALIAEAELELDRRLAEGFELAKERGWVRPDLDSLTTAAWINGMINGRIILEMNPEAYSRQAWTQTSSDAVLFVMGYVNDQPIWN
jgi:AcrR family transcriptional regulator